jgi:hypothetical protein
VTKWNQDQTEPIDWWVWCAVAIIVGSYFAVLIVGVNQ